MLTCKSRTKKGMTGLGLLAVLVIAAVTVSFTVACDQDTGTGPEVKDAKSALAAALSYVRTHVTDSAPAPTGEWKGENVTPANLVGATITRFALNEWTATVTSPVVAPENIIYQVSLSNSKTSQTWNGTVTPDGSVAEIQHSGATAQEQARQVAEQFVRSSSTFTFDGIAETLKLTQTSSPDSFRGWTFIFAFDCRQAGYGDRSGQMLAQVITRHEAAVGVEMASGKVIRAVMDGKWDMLKDQLLPGS